MGLTWRHINALMWMKFQASRPQKKTSWWFPSKLPPGKRRPSSGLQEDARPQATRSTWARPLQALPPWQTSSADGPSLPAGSEVSPGFPLAPRATCRSQRWRRPKLEQQENVRSTRVGHKLIHLSWVKDMLLMDTCGSQSVPSLPAKPNYLAPSDCVAVIRALKQEVGFLWSSSDDWKKKTWNELTWSVHVKTVKCLWMLSPMDYYVREI